MSSENRIMERLIDLKKTLEENNDHFLRNIVSIKESLSILEPKVKEIEEKFEAFKDLMKTKYTEAIVGRIEEYENQTRNLSTDIDLVKHVLSDKKTETDEINTKLSNINRRITMLEETVDKISRLNANSINERLLKLEKTFEKDEMEDSLRKLRGE